MPRAALAIGDVVDLERYPLDHPDEAAGLALVARCRSELADRGVCELPGFVRPEAVATLVADALEGAPVAHRTDDRHTVHFEPPVPGTGSRSLLQHSSKQTIAWDRLPAGSPLRTLYDFDPLTRFLGSALGLQEFHRYDDPLAACSVALFGPGDELGWHFDRSDVAVTLMLQPAEQGGEFEYVPAVRTERDAGEDAVLAVLGGTSDGVLRLTGASGTLALFRGHHALHRVTPVAGPTVRVNAVLAYAGQPGAHLNDLTRELFYGRPA